MPFVVSKLEIYAVITALLAAAAGAAWLYVATLRHERDAAVAQAAQSHVQAVVATGQTAVTQTAAAITDAGAQRQALDITVHQDNQHAIEAAPGASVALAPALNSAGRDGLCDYDAYAADPYCAQLRSARAAVLSQAGGPGAAAKP